MQKITPFLWFNKNAEQAAKFYISVFRDGRITKTTRYPEGGPGTPGSTMTVEFRLLGQEFVGLNGGPQFDFSEAVSFVVKCDSQRELDRYWEKLSAGGKKSHCGWLQDKFGLWWQIVPSEMDELFTAKDAGRTARVMQAMLNMKKLDIKVLREAAASEPDARAPRRARKPTTRSKKR